MNRCTIDYKSHSGGMKLSMAALLIAIVVEYVFLKVCK